MNSSLISDELINLLGEQGIDPEEFLLFQKLGRIPEYCHLTVDKMKFLQFFVKNAERLVDDFIIEIKNTFGGLQWVNNLELQPTVGLPFNNLLEKAKHDELIGKQVTLMDRSIKFDQIYDVTPGVIGFYEANILSLDEMKKNAQKYNFYKELNPCEIFLAFAQIKEEVKNDSQYYYYSRDDNNQLCRFCFHKPKDNTIQLSVGKVRTSHMSIYLQRYVTFGEKPIAA